LTEGRLYGFVITVCDESSAEQCPIFPGITARLHWSFEEPSTFTGSRQEQLAKTRLLRDKVKVKVLGFCENQPRIELK
jgi:arsenate reductase (thioredoxin)